MSHKCHWPGCPVDVPPQLFACKKHWFMLPKKFRDMIWDAYVPGQEITKRPTRKYILAVTQTEEWIKANYSTPKIKRDRDE